MLLGWSQPAELFGQLHISIEHHLTQELSVYRMVVLTEHESVEARDRYFPRPEETSEELRQFDEQHPAGPEWEKLTGFLSQPHSWTDYVVVGDSSSRT
jgi:hypothetical protein